MFSALLYRKPSFTHKDREGVHGWAKAVLTWIIVQRMVFHDGIFGSSIKVFKSSRNSGYSFKRYAIPHSLHSDSGHLFVNGNSLARPYIDNKYDDLAVLLHSVETIAKIAKTRDNVAARSVSHV